MKPKKKKRNGTLYKVFSYFVWQVRTIPQDLVTFSKEIII